MTPPIPDTLPSAFRVHPDVIRLERYIPFGLSLHATLLFIYVRNASAGNLILWAAFVSILLGSTWLLIQKDKARRFVFFRAVYLVAIIWGLTLTLNGSATFSGAWLLALCIVYPPLLPQRQTQAFLMGTAASYLLYSMTLDAVPLPLALLRAALVLFIGWMSYTVNVRVINAMMEHQETRQQLINAEIARQQLEKEKELYEQKMQFVNLVSHEFRTPLAIMESAGYLLELYYEQMKPEKRAKRIQEIRLQTARIAEMMDNIVTTEKLFLLPLPITPLTPVNLRELCAVVVDDLNSLAPGQARIVTTYEGALENIMVDGDHIRVILYHLLSNALKFSPAQSEVRLRVCSLSGYLVLRVTDHGVGISDHERQRLYQPFFRADNAAFIKGLGLGLALVYESVRQQGGSIDWHSEVDQGTMFEVRLPLET